MREAAGLAAGGFVALRSTEVTTPLAASNTRPLMNLADGKVGFALL